MQTILIVFILTLLLYSIATFFIYQDCNNKWEELNELKEQIRKTKEELEKRKNERD